MTNKGLESDTNQGCHSSAVPFTHLVPLCITHVAFVVT